MRLVPVLAAPTGSLGPVPLAVRTRGAVASLTAGVEEEAVDMVEERSVLSTASDKEDPVRANAVIHSQWSSLCSIQIASQFLRN